MIKVEKIIKACNILKEIHKRVSEKVKIGENLKKIDEFAGTIMEEHEAKSAPIVDYEFPNFTCISVNDVACHGVPEDKPIKEEDVVNIDISIVYDGHYADASRTYYFGKDEKILKLLEFAKSVHREAIEAIKEGDSILNMGLFVYDKCKEQNDFAVVHKYGGHFIGEKLHIKPFVPSILKPEDLLKYSEHMLKDGDCFCFEPIFTFKKNYESLSNVYQTQGWPVFQFNNFPCVHLENTYCIKDGRCVSLTGEI